MANKNPNTSGLNPAKKGEVRNPKGRPPNAAKKRIAGMLGIRERELNSNFDEKYIAEFVKQVMLLTKEQAQQLGMNPDINLAEVSGIKMVQKLIKTGDVKTWAELYQLITGKKLFDDNEIFTGSTVVNVTVTDKSHAAEYESLSDI